MVFGKNQENINNLTPSQKAENKLNDQPNNSIQNEKTSPTNSEYATDYNDELDSQKPTKALTLTQKTASLLEKGIKGISEIDRKSTRLNSSHVAISYDVFCLKKKKNKRI